MSRSLVVTLFGVVIAVVIYVFPFFSGSPQPHISRSTPYNPYGPHPISGLFPRHGNALVDQEATLLSYCPVGQQEAWLDSGRPPVYWSPQNQYYYFEEFGASRTSIADSVVLTPDFVNMFNPSPFPSWYGHPFH
ncbi:hypothetical protein SAMN00768000_3053 [Sulfobacillus thermosulfidooxidans DSM 9293]|uniref:Uncharacterized protein n=1 Tax=Sulfobacillus thermosulfidooxidans (strain DSM 9293 / VKM B-1269 / AT-1) TaxID=929705 RepID=A0A1W1WKL4_SULTA|nr:hypothetical protein [Sulfobacillus thermosulfidooxidans]SMC06851.1 hypothetical protein SAMN00768000_3053 [Sulfobacillus thermosulfidooxidans DSM 9293]